MAYERVSDISHQILPDDQHVSLVVRNAPGLDKPRQLDLSLDEAASIERLTDTVELELSYPDGRFERAICTLLTFSEVVPPEVLEQAPGTRGRRKNFKPGQTAP